MRDARQVAEHSARNAYGRLLALLASRSRDIAASEDSLSEAFLAALRTWPDTGVPSNPEAWLFSVARNNHLNSLRHRAVVESVAADVALMQDEMAPEAEAIPDDRLKLLFVCAHPAIDISMRTPLMLQTVLGLDAAEIGAAFLVAPATMGQRLVRAKAKIRDTGLRFELPEPEDLAERLGDVLNAIYAAFGVSWDAVPGADAGCADLSAEAIFLAQLLVSLMPAEPEARGLLALMLYCQARRPARWGPDGAFVPLARQDHRLWSRELIVEAERQLTTASASGIFGRYQCEAAIQSVHVQTPLTGVPQHAALNTLYGLLASHYPSAGVLTAQAAALSESGDHAGGLAVLNRLDADDIQRYQPYWVTLASILARLGDQPGAMHAQHIAIGLTEAPALRDFLMQSLARI